MIVYQGPSRLDRTREIVGIVTGFSRPSQNAKTGDLLQLWILPSDQHPAQARGQDDESGTCGDCPLSGYGGGCYVDVGQAPAAVWRAYRAGWYGRWTPDRHRDELRRSAGLRLGAYGDAAALPARVVRELVRTHRDHCPTQGVTGYTHQWRRSDCQWLKGFCLASCETWHDATTAAAAGWRVFHAGPEDERPAGLVECPAESHGITCQQCKLCDASRVARSIFIEPHGKFRANMLRTIAER